jgi:hypothetical protein
MGSVWVETIPSTSPPFPTIQDINFFSEGPTGPSGLAGPTGPSGGPIGPTGYTGHTGPLPDFSVSYGPDNGLIGSVNYDTSYGYGIMWSSNNSSNFLDAIGKLSIGDTFSGTISSHPFNSGTRTFTLATLPAAGILGDLAWYVYENDAGRIGSYGLLTFNSLQGKPGPTGPAGPGLATSGNSTVSSNLIPATGNLYSLGNSTNWWKDVWISANTFYVGGTPISVNSKGHVVLGNVEITGSISNAQFDALTQTSSTEPVMTYNYNFGGAITNYSTYHGNSALLSSGYVAILGVGWPEKPGTSYLGADPDTGTFKSTILFTGTDATGTDQYSTIKTQLITPPDGKYYQYMKLTNKNQPSEFCVFSLSSGASSNDNNKTFELSGYWITGTVNSTNWTSNNIEIIVEFSKSTMHGKIPLLNNQSFWWTKAQTDTGGITLTGAGLNMWSNSFVAYIPLTCTGLSLYPPATNQGKIYFPNTQVWDGKTITAWIWGNGIAKSNLVNVSTTNLPTTIPANSFVNMTYMNNVGKWVVTYQGNV